jgi:hypothetical protein
MMNVGRFITQRFPIRSAEIPKFSSVMSPSMIVKFSDETFVLATISLKHLRLFDKSRFDEQKKARVGFRQLRDETFGDKAGKSGEKNGLPEIHIFILAVLFLLYETRIA